MEAVAPAETQQTRGGLIAGGAFFLAVCLLLGWGGMRLAAQLTAGNQLPMAALVVQGNHRYVREQELREALSRLPEMGNFFTLDVNRVQQTLQALPWIYRVSVRKQWPDRLKIYVEEQQPQALWNQGQLLNEAGEVFTAPLERLEAPLVNLYGPEGQHRLVLDTYRKIDELLSINGYGIRAVAMTVRQAWQVTLADGTELRLGRENLLQRIQRVIDLVPVVRASDERPIAYLDLRYDTGLAVGWQTQQ